jgi:hypothetical protein
VNNRDLTSQQELFLEYLFNDPECGDDTMKACEKAGYGRHAHAKLVRSLRDEIIKRAEEELARNAPKAVKGLLSAMNEDGSVPRGDVRLKAVESILDRIGLAKKQQMEVSSSDATPIFFIPSKMEEDK